MLLHSQMLGEMCLANKVRIELPTTTPRNLLWSLSFLYSLLRDDGISALDLRSRMLPPVGRARITEPNTTAVRVFGLLMPANYTYRNCCCYLILLQSVVLRFTQRSSGASTQWWYLWTGIAATIAWQGEEGGLGLLDHYRVCYTTR